MFCGKCGKEVPEGYEFCMNCGTKLALEVEETISPVKVKKKKKWLIIPIVLILLAVIVIGVLYFITICQERKGLYNNIAWGTPYREVKEIVGADYKDGPESVLADYEKQMIYDSVDDYQGFEEVGALVFYDCNNGGTLQAVRLIVTNGDDSNYSNKEIFEGLEEKFSKLYGEGIQMSSSKKIWNTEESKIIFEQMTGNIFTVEYVKN